MRIIGIGYLSESSVCYIDNGKIKLNSSVGVGSEFILTLPREK